MNEIKLMGRLTKDVEIVRKSDKSVYAKFVVAIQTKKDQKSTFIPCVAWNKIAETLEKYVGKGNRILINGQLNIYYKDQKQYALVNVKNFSFIDYKNSNNLEKRDSATDPDFPF